MVSNEFINLNNIYFIIVIVFYCRLLLFLFIIGKLKPFGKYIMLSDSVLRQFIQEPDTVVEINDYLLDPLTGSYLNVSSYSN